MFTSKLMQEAISTASRALAAGLTEAYSRMLNLSLWIEHVCDNEYRVMTDCGEIGRLMKRGNEVVSLAA